MKYLVVVAHPDDEVLGAGASIWKFTRSGAGVDLCVLCSEAKARTNRPDDRSLEDDLNKSSEYLGIGHIYRSSFPNIEMNTVPHLALVQAIEDAILKSRPDIVITHHPCDLNNDHMQTSFACQEAVRIFQRRPEEHPVSEVWFMEVPSSTEWSLNSGFNRFQPNLFIETGREGVDAKLKALSMYRGVMRPFPHSRSEEYITGLAAVRGGQGGVEYAEGFEVVFRRVK